MALPDNQHALSASDDKTVKLFNVNDGAVLRTFTQHTDKVYCLALLPDGLRFVSGSDETAHIAYHGLAFTPEPAWLEAEAAARASRKKEVMAASARLRGFLAERIERLSALEAGVETAAGGVDVDARLRELDSYMASYE